MLRVKQLVTESSQVDVLFVCEMAQSRGLLIMSPMKLLTYLRKIETNRNTKFQTTEKKVTQHREKWRDKEAG